VHGTTGPQDHRTTGPPGERDHRLRTTRPRIRNPGSVVRWSVVSGLPKVVRSPSERVGAPAARNFVP
jgi:hypothetical protein